MEKKINHRSCMVDPKPDHLNDTQTPTIKLPSIDIFLNPAKKTHREDVVNKKQEIAKNYFKKADMRYLYPELFRILWESTLPCFRSVTREEHMLVSCQLAGVEVNCSDLFSRVPTDTGMCCALNVEDSLRDSEYQGLIKEMQGETKTTKVESKEGKRNGLRLTLDLHSNTVSFGSLDQQYSAFNLFIGQPAQFPMMREKSIQVSE